VYEIIASDIHGHSDHLDQEEARYHLREQELKGAQGRGLETFQKPVLAVPHDHVAHTEEATEHHIHGKDAGHDPVHISDLMALDHQSPISRSSLTPEYPLDQIPVWCIVIDPVPPFRMKIDEHVELEVLDFVDCLVQVINGDELDIPCPEKFRVCCRKRRRVTHHADLVHSLWVS
jgi:hypothetical protein